MAPVTRTRSKALDKTTREENGRVASATAVETSVVRGNNKQNEKSSEPSSPTTTRQRLAVRTRDEAGDPDNAIELHRVRVETQLLTGKSKRPRSRSVADSQDGDRVDEAAGANHDDDDTALEPQSASKQLEEEASQRLASQSVEPDLESSPQIAKGKEGKSKHVVFGDDDDVDKYVAAAAETARDAKQAPEAAAEDEDEDSDDAPEAVSTKVAAKETLESAKALADATEKQATLLKRKRQERDNLFKQQAQKRKRVSEPKAEGEAAPEPAATAGRRRAEKQKLPSILPAEFLTDSSSDSEDEDEAALLRRVVKKPKKINFEDRAPRDQVVGSTLYRVVADSGDKKLAPKMHKDSRNLKQDMLKRKRVAVTPNKRKGFFVKK